MEQNCSPSLRTMRLYSAIRTLHGVMMSSRARRSVQTHGTAVSRRALPSARGNIHSHASSNSNIKASSSACYSHHKLSTRSALAMALPTQLLAIVFSVLLASPAGAEYTRLDFAGGYELGDCSRDPRWLSTANGTAFRASLAPLLAALPSAAAPTGFASLRSADGRAFARGFCYGESTPPHDCRKCLSRSRAWLFICSGSGRAGFWNPRCFLAYGDTNASSASEDEQATWTFDYDGDVANYYPTFYDMGSLVDLAQSLAPRAANSGGRMLATANVTAQANSTVRALAQCPGNVTAADCARCLETSAQEYLPACLRVPGHDYNDVQSAGVANVFRYNCYLRLEISAPMLPMGKGARFRKKMNDHPAVVVVVAVAIMVMIAGAALLVLNRIHTSKAQAARHVDS